MQTLHTTFPLFSNPIQFPNRTGFFLTSTTVNSFQLARRTSGDPIAATTVRASMERNAIH